MGKHVHSARHRTKIRLRATERAFRQRIAAAISIETRVEISGRGRRPLRHCLELYSARLAGLFRAGIWTFALYGHSKLRSAWNCRCADRFELQGWCAGNGVLGVSAG